MTKYYLSEKKIIIYAAGATSTIISNVLMNKGLSVECYIDKRAKDLKEKSDLLVYSLKEVQTNIKNKDDYCVIITPKNVFEHTEIANRLSKIGFKNIIFKPKEILLGKSDTELLNINSIFDKLVTKKEVPTTEICQYICNNKEFTDQIICYEKDYVKIWLPSELLFSNVSNNSIWSDINMQTHFPLIELYKLFLGKNLQSPDKVLDNYIDYSAYGAKLINIDVSESWKENAINTRAKIFKEMYKIQQIYPDFFQINCPIVKYVNNNKFNIISSGKNRMAFLISMGYEFVPVKMKKIDYEKWLHNDNILKLKNYIEKNMDGKLDYAVPHPMFTDLTLKFVNYMQLWCSEIAIRLVKKIYMEKHMFDYNNLYILDFSRDNGYLNRFLSSIGFKVFSAETNTELEELLDKAFNIERLIVDSSEKNTYHAMIIDSKDDVWETYIEDIDNELFLLNWDNDYKVINKLKKYNFYIKEKIFSSYNMLGFVEGIMLERRK